MQFVKVMQGKQAFWKLPTAAALPIYYLVDRISEVLQRISIMPLPITYPPPITPSIQPATPLTHLTLNPTTQSINCKPTKPPANYSSSSIPIYTKLQARGHLLVHHIHLLSHALFIHLHYLPLHLFQTHYHLSKPYYSSNHPLHSLLSPSSKPIVLTFIHSSSPPILNT